MKPAAITLMLVLLVAVTANAQLSFLPQIGFEQSKTSVRVNDLSSFSPMGFTNNFKANLRADYRFKKGHGPYISIGTTPGAIAFSFSEVANVSNNFKAASNALQFKIESGYQYSSKPISLKKTTKKQTAQRTTQTVVTNRRCGTYSYYHRERTTTTPAIKQNNNLNMRLQPSIGVAYIPSVKNDIISNGSVYQYNAGNYKTAMVSGMGFEFGKGTQRLFTISIFYTKGFSNLKEQEITNTENNKINTRLNSNSSAWGMTIGMPFSFSKNKKIAAVPTQTKIITEQRHRYQYRSKCGSYNGRCTRRI
jgi:hypothetical protein